MNNRIRAGLWASLKGKKNGKRWEEIVGYSIDDLMRHLERCFLVGMSWQNYGDWHIDHIRPLATFAFTGFDDPSVQEAWALTNLRPLWAADNLAKKDSKLFLI